MKTNYQNLWQVFANSSDFGTQCLAAFITRKDARNYVSENKRRLSSEYSYSDIKHGYTIRKCRLSGVNK